MTAISGIAGLGGETAATRGKKQLGQEDFLKLMVAQLKNQDPSNPVDNAQFLGQIAQFSMVSGIDEMKTSFNSMAGSLYGSQAMEASSLIGREVLARSSTVLLKEGQGVEGMIELPMRSTAAQVSVYDASGSLVGEYTLPGAQAGLQPFRWDGLDSEGEPLPAGRYHIEARAAMGGEIEAVDLQVYRQVESVSVNRENTSVRLHLEGDESINLSEVREYK